MKQVKILSRKTAEKITLQLLDNKETQTSALFLDELYYYRKHNHHRLKQMVKTKPGI